MYNDTIFANILSEIQSSIGNCTIMYHYTILGSILAKTDSSIGNCTCTIKIIPGSFLTEIQSTTES